MASKCKNIFSPKLECNVYSALLCCVIPHSYLVDKINNLIDYSVQTQHLICIIIIRRLRSLIQKTEKSRKYLFYIITVLVSVGFIIRILNYSTWTLLSIFKVVILYNSIELDIEKTDTLFI